jgi:hypothetical protein
MFHQKQLRKKKDEVRYTRSLHGISTKRTLGHRTDLSRPITTAGWCEGGGEALRNNVYGIRSITLEHCQKSC